MQEIPHEYVVFIDSAGKRHKTFTPLPSVIAAYHARGYFPIKKRPPKELPAVDHRANDLLRKEIDG